MTPIASNVAVPGDQKRGLLNSYELRLMCRDLVEQQGCDLDVILRGSGVSPAVAGRIRAAGELGLTQPAALRTPRRRRLQGAHDLPDRDGFTSSRPGDRKYLRVTPDPVQ